MQKNNFMKNVLAAMMLLAGTSTMVSCSGLIDAIVGETDTPASTSKPTEEKSSLPENITITDDGAKVEASSAEEVSAALQALVKDIEEKGVGEGKEYVFEVSSDVFNTGDVENIEVPEIEGATINIVITTPFTKPTTLVFSSNKSAATREMAATRGDDEESDAVDKMYVTLPETVGDNYPTFEFQRSNTMIFMESANGNSVINVKDVNEKSVSGAALWIGKGISIDTYKWTPRSATEYLRLYMSFIEFFDSEKNVDKFISFNWNDEDRSGEDLIVKNLKIEKTDVMANLIFGANAYGKITIADGVTVTSENKTMAESRGPEAEEIESEGKSTVLTTSKSNKIYYKKAKGIIFATTSTKSSTLTSCNADLEDCSFEFNKVIFGLDQTGFKYASDPLLKDCSFDSELIDINITGEETGEFEFTFSGCDLSDGSKICLYPHNPQTEAKDKEGNVVYTYQYEYFEEFIDEVTGETGYRSYVVDKKEYLPDDVLAEGEKESEEELRKTYKGYCKYNIRAIYKDVPFTNFVIRVYLKSCTYGGEALTSQSGFVWDDQNIPEGVTMYYNIDGIDYKVSYEDKKIKLTKV